MEEEESRIIYCSKDNQQEKTFEALAWLAIMTIHIPNYVETNGSLSRFFLFGLRVKVGENRDLLKYQQDV